MKFCVQLPSANACERTARIRDYKSDTETVFGLDTTEREREKTGAEINGEVIGNVLYITSDDSIRNTIVRMRQSRKSNCVYAKKNKRNKRAE